MFAGAHLKDAKINSFGRNLAGMALWFFFYYELCPFCPSLVVPVISSWKTLNTFPVIIVIELQAMSLVLDNILSNFELSSLASFIFLFVDLVLHSAKWSNRCLYNPSEPRALLFCPSSWHGPIDLSSCTELRTPFGIIVGCR